MKPIQRILIPTDGSRPTQVLLEVVRARYPQAQIRLLQVGQMLGLGQPSPGSEEGARLQGLAQAAWRQKEVVEVIVEEALAWRADMLALCCQEGKVGWLSPLNQALLRRLPLEVMLLHLPKRVVEIYVGWAEPEAPKGSLALEKAPSSRLGTTGGTP
ncbi:hypothetical protein [Meiothermus rufus]|uniref:hypothetical protein n=1 Tax=Meiothermus rufus TaxID=604332 RepID=UPI00041DD72B|nr:hypothetical protein [Meiothermus rufus]